MAVKLDTEKRLFVGPTAVRQGSVQDAIRSAVNELGGNPGGEGVTYADLEAHLIANFAPKKSQGYGPSYIKAYVRDAVNRYDYLSHEDGGHEYSAIEAAPKAAAEPKPKKMTKAQQAEIDTLNFIRTRGEVTDAGDLDSTQITVQDFVTETGKKTKTVANQLTKLEERGLVRTEEREGNEEGQTSTYVFLTTAGFAMLNDAQPEATGAPTSAVGSDGGDAA